TTSATLIQMIWRRRFCRLISGRAMSMAFFDCASQDPMCRWPILLLSNDLDRRKNWRGRLLLSLRGLQCPFSDSIARPEISKYWSLKWYLFHVEHFVRAVSL